MNRYPLWKYVVIAAALLFSIIYALPNFYGESPAVQIAAEKGAEKPSLALLQRVEALLAQKHLAYQGTLLDSDSVKVRFADTNTQLKAKDWLQSKLGTGYSVALNLLPRSPAWLSDIGALPMYLGLDLRGGVHFLLQVDMKAAVDKSLGHMVGEIRTALRAKDIRYSGARRQGNLIEVRFRTAAARTQAETQLATDVPDLQFKESSQAGALLLVGTLKSSALRQMRDYAVQQNITTLRNRVNELGVAEPIIQQQGVDRVVVELPGVQDTAKAKEILGRTATLEIRMVDEAHSNPASLQAASKGQVPYGDNFYVDREGSPLLVKKTVILTGESIDNARPGFDSQTGDPTVDITLDGTGSRIFQRVTRENVGKRMAILLVEQGKAEVVTAPVIRSEIAGGRVQISGNMTTREASDVALLLRAGALAAPMNIIEERTVGPSLGAANIKQGFYSTLIGFAAIALFMMFYYRLFGVFSTLALAINLLFLVAVLSVLQATLTLPGIAGIALTVGMAIDANVLINERIREELRNGSTPQASIHVGYDRAFDTILDSNITTLIAGIALFWLGSGPVRGFAVTLCIGILTSMFSAVMVSRGMANLVYGRRRRLSTLAI